MIDTAYYEKPARASRHMPPPELPPADARRIVRRCVHDLNNAVNCLHIEVSLLSEDLPDPPFDESFQKVRRQLAYMESAIRSLAVRFSEPTLSLIPAADIFHTWRDKVENAGYQIDVTWEEPATNPLIKTDMHSLLTVLREITLAAGNGDREKSRTARLQPAPGGGAAFELKEKAPSARQTPAATSSGSGESTAASSSSLDPDTERDWSRLATSAGGSLHHRHENGAAITSITFPNPGSEAAGALFLD